MAGKRGRSGRVELTPEGEMLRKATVDLAWKHAYKRLSSDDTPITVKDDFAKHILSKSMPTILANPDGSPLTVNNLWGTINATAKPIDRPAESGTDNTAVAERPADPA